MSQGSVQQGPVGRVPLCGCIGCKSLYTWLLSKTRFAHPNVLGLMCSAHYSPASELVLDRSPTLCSWVAQ
jgi:hypothetical protein